VLAFDPLKEGKEGTILTVPSTCSMIEISRPQDEKSRMKEGREDNTMRLKSTLWSRSLIESHLPSHPSPGYACMYYADRRTGRQTVSQLVSQDIYGI
jgi:hypothetical protein